MQNDVEDLFAELLGRTPEDRRNYLARSEYGQNEVAAAMRLLSAFESQSNFLNNDLLTDLANLDPEFFISDSADDNVLNSGDRIGVFEVAERCGEGGMSIVYRATQSEPINRQVALKLIRPSVLTAKAVLRFFREQQALASVNHPNIATLYEVGTTPDGQPYAAMEYVNGLPITDFCKQHSASLKFKLELFAKACEGLAQAHKHGIVHRDIKPDNILVTIRSGVAVPKLIDFGIAKFIRPGLDDQATMTRTGQVLGSPRYMSPEQIEGREVDQRSDVYSAGLVLFELLSLSPYRKGDTAEQMMTSAQTEVELLSDRLRSLLIAPECDVPKESLKPLLKVVKRDLNWILAKALSREPAERYPSIDAMLSDLAASSRGDSLSVARPGFVDNASQFFRTQRTSILVCSIAAMVLVSALFYFNWRQSVQQLSQTKSEAEQVISETKRKSVEQLTDAKIQSDKQLQQVELEKQTELDAIRQASILNQRRNAASNELIIRLFASGEQPLTAEHLDMGSIRMYQDQYEQIQFSGGPSNHEEETVYGILAVFYAMSGDFDKAENIMAQVADIQQRQELKTARIRICENYAKMAKKKLATLPESERSLERAGQQLVLGRCYMVLDMLGESEELIRDAVDIFDAFPVAVVESLNARNTLARLYQRSGKQAEYQTLVSATYQKFKDNQALLSERRGHAAFAKTVRMATTMQPDSWELQPK